MKTIVFYSYKGGVGRTLLLANYARYLCACGKKVFILDCDLEAPGLHHKFAQYGLYNDFETWQKSGLPRYGLVDYIAEFMKESGGQIPATLDEFVCKLELHQNGTCYFMPAGKAPSSDYANTLLRLDWKQLFPLAQSPTALPLPAVGVPFFRHLKERIQTTDEYKPDFLLIDSRTGITDVGSVTVRFLADTLVCLFMMNPENIEGTKAILTSVRQADAVHPSEFVPVLSRVPDVPHDQEVALTSEVLEKLGSASARLSLHILHNEPNLPVVEALRFGSDKALCDSVLLRDYLKVFCALDKETAVQSPYYKLIEHLGSQATLPIGAKNASQDEVPVREKIRRRDVKVLKHAGHYNYVTGRHYEGLTSAMAKMLVTFLRNEIPGLSPTPVPVAEKDINWDLLGTQMLSQIFDFCSEPYFLTPGRGHIAGIVQFGWVETFTCFARKSTNVYAELKKHQPTQKQDELSNHVEHHFASLMRAVVDTCGPVLVGMMGESAAANEASQNISPFISGSHLQFLRDAEALWNWITKKEEFPKLIVCDHTVANKMGLLARDEDEAYAFAENEQSKSRHLVFRFSSPLPVGFLHPVADRDWRYLINRALGEAVTEDLWEEVRMELHAVGVKPLSWRDLKRQIVLGKNPEDAYQWLAEIHHE